MIYLSVTSDEKTVEDFYKFDSLDDTIKFIKSNKIVWYNISDHPFYDDRLVPDSEYKIDKTRD